MMLKEKTKPETGNCAFTSVAMTIDPEALRPAFERWVVANVREPINTVGRMPSGRYWMTEVQTAWLAYCAAIEADRKQVSDLISKYQEKVRALEVENYGITAQEARQLATNYNIKSIDDAIEEINKQILEAAKNGKYKIRFNNLKFAVNLEDIKTHFLGLGYSVYYFNYDPYSEISW